MVLFQRGFFSSVIAALLCLAGNGCTPHAESQSDEQKDPSYLSGLNRRRDLDFKGAIEHFEKALEINPRSASAHYELAIIYDEHEKDYAAALYHYDRVVKLRPNNAYPADNANQRIAVCKQELTKSVSIAPIIQTMQSDMVKLQGDLARITAENQQLKKQLDAAQPAMANRGQRMPGFTELPGTNLGPRLISTGTSSNLASTGKAPAAGNPRSTAPPTGQVNALPSPPARGLEKVALRMKTHAVVSGENPTCIARKYSVKLSALMAANPHLDPKRLKPGQTLNIPAP